MFALTHTLSRNRRHQELHDTAQQQLQTEVESLRNRSTQLQDIK